MNVTLTEKKDTEDSIELKLEIAAEDVASKYKEILQKFSASAQIPGFRKGKAPKQYLEKRFGESLKGELFEELIPEAIKQTLEQEKLEIYGNPSLPEKPEYESGKALNLCIRFEKPPHVAMPELEKMSMLSHEIVITDADLAAQGKSLMENLVQAKERSDSFIKLDDFIKANIVFSDSRLEKFSLKEHMFMFPKEGKGPFPGYLAPLKEFLIDKAKPKDTLELEMEFTEPHEHEDLKGKKTKLKVEILSVVYKEYPELNQETLKKLGLNSKEEFEAELQESTAELREHVLLSWGIKNLLNEIRPHAKFHVPQQAIESVVAGQWQQFQAMMQQQSGGVSKHQAAGKPSGDWLRRASVHARMQIENSLIYESLNKSFALSLDDEEVEKEIQKKAKQAKAADKASFRRDFLQDEQGYKAFEEQLLYKKTWKFAITKCQQKKGSSFNLEQALATH